MSDIKAREGQWYADRANHDVFCVIGIDESDGLIDVRDRYGDIDEFDLEEWESMDLELCAAPEWDLQAPEAESEELDDVDSEPQPAATAPPADAIHHRKSSGTT